MFRTFVKKKNSETRQNIYIFRDINIKKKEYIETPTDPLVAVVVGDVAPVVGVHGVADHEARDPLLPVAAPLRDHARYLGKHQYIFVKKKNINKI